MEVRGKKVGFIRKLGVLCHLVDRCLVAESCLTFWDPVRLLSPWDFPGKDTGVGCHFLLHMSPGASFMNIYYSQVIHYGKATMFITGTWWRGKGETIQRWLSLYRDGFRKAHEDGGVWGAPVIKGTDYHRGMGWPAWLTEIGCVRCRISNQNWGIHAPPSLPRCRSFQYYNNKSHKQMKWITINNRQQEISVAPPRREGWGDSWGEVCPMNKDDLKEIEFGYKDLELWADPTC